MAGNFEALGVDIGRGITPETTDGRITVFGDDYRGMRPHAGAFDTLRDLGEQRFGQNIYLVSKCGPKIQERTLELLNMWDFYRETGIDRSRVYFCRDIAGKGPFASALSLTDFLDDREDVLELLPDSVTNKMLFIPPEEAAPAAVAP